MKGKSIDRQNESFASHLSVYVLRDHATTSRILFDQAARRVNYLIHLGSPHLPKSVWKPKKTYFVVTATTGAVRLDKRAADFAEGAFRQEFGRARFLFGGGGKRGVRWMK